MTVDIITDGPAPVLLRQLTDVRIMSKSWCEKHNVVEVQDYLAQGGNLRRRARRTAPGPTC